MTDLGTPARQFVKALEALRLATQAYYDALHAAGLATGDATGRGLNSRQIEGRLRAEIIAALSPRPGATRALLKFEGAPEARRYVAGNPLPGLLS